MDYYAKEKCSAIAQIQVIWSDLDSSPPAWLDDGRKFPKDKFVVEKHYRNNSLTNRFRPLVNIPSEVSCLAF